MPLPPITQSRVSNKGVVMAMLSYGSANTTLSAFGMQSHSLLDE